MLIISWPWALFRSKSLIIFPMSLSVNVMLDKDLSIRLSQFVGSTLVFLISEHWLAKKLISLFSEVSNNFVFIKNRRNTRKIDQYVFEMILGLDKFLAILRNILALKLQLNYSTYFEGNKIFVGYYCYLQNLFCSKNV